MRKKTKDKQNGVTKKNSCSDEVKIRKEIV